MKPGSPARQAAALVLSALPRRRCAMLLVLMLLVSLTEGVGLFLLVPVIGAVGDGTLPPAVSEALRIAGLPLRLGPLLAAFVFLAAARGILQYARTIEGRRLSHLLVDGLRLRCVRLVLGARWPKLAAMRQSDNASLIITNIDRVDGAFQYLHMLLATVVTLAGAGLTALLLSPRMAVLAGGSGVLVLLAYRGLRSRAMHLGDVLTDAYEGVFARVSESLGALRLIKSLGAEQRTEDALRATFVALREAELAYQRSAARGQAALQVCGAAVLALASWLAIERLGVQPTVLVPLVALFARALPLLGGLQECWQGWLHGVPAIADTARLIDMLEAEQEPALVPGVRAPALLRSLALKNVTMHHEGRDAPALAGVSLSLPANTTTALVGPSGAGKSTLADVVGGLLEPSGGALLIDGEPVQGPLLRAWRGEVAYVQQEPVLFHATIRENLLWAAPDAHDEELAAALDDAAATFVHALPDGLDTMVGDRGARLSGGERQRLALARALLQRPRMLILDEPTSALDRTNELAIAEALQRLRGRITLLLIAHRGALSEVADRIVTLENGRVVAIMERPGADRGQERSEKVASRS